MDFCWNVVTGDSFNHHQEQLLSSPSSNSTSTNLITASIDDLFPVQNTEVDVSLEWLSVFVEDCLSSTGNGLPPPPPPPPPANATVIENTTPQTQKPQQQNNFPKFLVPCKARTKRTRPASRTKTTTNPLLMSWSSNTNPIFNQNLNFNTTTNDPPLLQQAYWLADSELIVIKSEDKKQEEVLAAATSGEEQQQQQQGRRCTHCLSQRTPQWRAGPLGAKTLCNACGVRYKSGRLLPEYRPAKSPTFVSYLHSNSHKKVLEMRSSETTTTTTNTTTLFH